MPCTCRTENEKQHNFLRWVQNKWAYMVSIVYIEANQFCIETVGPEWVKGRISVDAGACQSALLYAPRVREGSEKKNAFTDCCKGVSFGGSRGSRTPDPLLVRQTLWTSWAKRPLSPKALQRYDLFWNYQNFKEKNFRKGCKNAKLESILVKIAVNWYICLCFALDGLCSAAADSSGMACLAWEWVEWWCGRRGWGVI